MAGGTACCQLAISPMSLIEHSELQRALTRLTSGMLNYMDSDEPSYTEEDIDKCRDILTSHVKALELVKDRAEMLKLVKSTVVQLNGLNQDTGGDLIETDQREWICEFIIKAGSLKGFNSENEDITEEWREW
jgi:hypothetical protein